MAFGRGEVWDEIADAGPEAFDGAFRVFAQVRLEFGEGLLDRIEVGRVRRQVAKRGAGLFDQAAHLFALVRTEIVHDDDVAWLKGRNERLFDIGLEAFGVHRPVEDHGRGQAVDAQASGEGGDLPVAVRGAAFQALAARTAAVKTRHVGGAARLIDEDQFSRIEPFLIGRPEGAGGRHVGARLLAGQNAFF